MEVWQTPQHCLPPRDNDGWRPPQSSNGLQRQWQCSLQVGSDPGIPLLMSCVLLLRFFHRTRHCWRRDPLQCTFCHTLETMIWFHQWISMISVVQTEGSLLLSSACIWLYLESHRVWIFNGSVTYIDTIVYPLVLYVIESRLYNTLFVKLYGNFKVFFVHLLHIVSFLQTPRSFNFALLHYR